MIHWFALITAVNVDEVKNSFLKGIGNALLSILLLYTERSGRGITPMGDMRV